MLETFVWMIVAITGLFLTLVVPLIGIVAMVKPSWFSRIGENRKKICLRLFGAFLVGCVMLAFLPVKGEQEKTTVQQDSAQTPKQKEKELADEVKKHEDNIKKLEAERRASMTMTMDKYNRIEMGMTAEEVKGIVGSLGKVMSESDVAGYKTVIVTFEGNGSIGSNANITFQNGRVMSKAQVGLK